MKPLRSKTAPDELCNLKVAPYIRDELRKIALRSKIPLHELTAQILLKYLKTHEMLQRHRHSARHDEP